MLKLPFLVSMAFAALPALHAEISVDQKMLAIRQSTIERGTARIERIKADLASFKQAPSDDLLLKLGDDLARLYGRDYRHKELQDQAAPLRVQLREALLRTPGHAEVYQRLIASQRPDALDGKRWNNYNQSCFRASQALAQLPSPESVRVLAGMLEDKKGMSHEDSFPNQPRETFSTASSAAEHAMLALGEIGIEDPPTAHRPQRSKDDPVNIDTWKEWWAEVQGGKRTYRFQNSPKTYDAKGLKEG